MWLKKLEIVCVVFCRVLYLADAVKQSWELIELRISARS